MDQQRIKQFFNWITTVKVNQMALVEYSDVTTYLKQSEKVKRIEEVENYIYKVIRENSDLKQSNDVLTALNSKMVVDIQRIKKEREIALNGLIK